MIVDGVDGFLFAPDDPADLKEKIRRLVTEPGLYQKIVRGTAPPRHVSTQVDEIELLLNQALKDTRSDPQRFSPGPRQDEQDV